MHAWKAIVHDMFNSFTDVVSLVEVKRQLDDALNHRFKKLLDNVANGVNLKEDWHFLVQACNKDLQDSSTILLCATKDDVNAYNERKIAVFKE